MKERKNAGATHSFRLTMNAANLVDTISYPRRLGGKSKKVSDAIEAYFGNKIDDGHEIPSYDDLLKEIALLEAEIADYQESIGVIKKLLS